MTYVADDFSPAHAAQEPHRPAVRRREIPWGAAAVLALIVGGCLLADAIAPGDANRMDLTNCSMPPCAAYPLGTDPLGRSLFAMLWHGGRVSLLIGVLSTILSTVIALVYGAASGLAPHRVDAAMTRLAEILLSVPELLLVLFLQAIWGEATVFSLSLVIGLTSWCSIARVVRAEVRRLREMDFVIAAHSMGAGFWRITWKHLTPNFLSSILFMIVMNIRAAIVAESTLSFMGLGLPLDTVSWGGMLSGAEQALLTGAWWQILLPGLFLVITLTCVTDIANALRGGERHSNL